MYGNFHAAKITDGRPFALYNLENDISETNNLAAQYPDIVEKLLIEAEKARNDLGDMGVEGNGVRPAAIVENPIVQLLN
jgi:hypothetical protein